MSLERYVLHSIGVVAIGTLIGTTTHSMLPVCIAVLLAICLMGKILMMGIEDAWDALQRSRQIKQNRKIQPLIKNEIMLCVSKEIVKFLGWEEDGMVSFSREYCFMCEDPLEYKQAMQGKTVELQIIQQREIYRIELLYPLKNDKIVVGGEDDYFAYGLLELFPEDIDLMNTDQLRRILRIRVQAAGSSINSLASDIDKAVQYFEVERVRAKENQDWIKKKRSDGCTFFRIDELGCIQSPSGGCKKVIKVKL